MYATAGLETKSLSHSCMPGVILPTDMVCTHYVPIEKQTNKYKSKNRDQRKKVVKQGRSADILVYIYSL